MSSKYRADIDALRALAVSAVVIFHAFPTLLPGGFVGVDVFFVISGYLITGILLRDMAEGKYSVARFYGRRIRRIFPALLCVLVACGVAGWWLLLSYEYKALGRHTVAASAFVSNFALWRESGYFDDLGDTKPLLHLWSLGIEEQYYIVWPLLVWACIRFRFRVLHVAIAVAAVSFVVSITLLLRDATAAFYSPASRAWELLVGSMLATAEYANSPRWRAWVAKPWIGPVGAATILSGLVLIDPHSAFPGGWALLPVVGTALVIAAGSSSPMNVWVGSQRGVVWLGEISYPLYLWHWPLFAMATMLSGGAPPVLVRVGLVLASMALAWLTFRLVEMPTRRHPRFAVSTGLVAGLTLVGGAGLYVRAHDGLPGRASVARYEGLAGGMLEDTQAAFKPFPCRVAPSLDLPDAPTLRYCLVSHDAPPTAALLGDSHADHLFYGISRVDPDRTWMLIGHNATPPFRGIRTVEAGQDDQRRERTERALDILVADRSIETVVVSFFFNTYVADTAFAADHVRQDTGPAHVTLTSVDRPGASKVELAFHGLDATIGVLEGAGKKVVLALDIPELPFMPRDCIPRPGSELFQRPCLLDATSVAARQEAMRSVAARLSALHPALRLYDPTPLLCPGTRCRFRDDDAVFYRDSHHLTPTGSIMVARDLKAMLARADD